MFDSDYQRRKWPVSVQCSLTIILLSLGVGAFPEHEAGLGSPSSWDELGTLIQSEQTVKLLCPLMPSVQRW